MSNDDRRTPGATRIPFDSIVEVGGALGPSFEAQAVNVSEEGMHLRTAYLPELGQQVTCRFETAPGRTVIASGEVVWSRGADERGEFGIRFVEVDPDSVEALKRACGLGGTIEPAQPGSKVRLYIEGLASPMRAKIREARASAITVGSDLGFLQVGKQLELEDTQSGSKRPASIDRVEVAVDPTSHIPQLVVTLRYADVPAEPIGAAAPDKRESEPPQPEDDLTSMHEASDRMRGAFARQAVRIGPAFGRFAQRAKTTMILLAKRRRADHESVPRRTTAPPPGGGLHASGRRVVRGDAGAPANDETTVTPKARTNKRRAAMAAMVMIVAVLAAVAIKRPHHDAPPEGSATVAAADTSFAVAAKAPAATTLSASAPTGIPAQLPPTEPAATGSHASTAASVSTPDDGTDDSHKNAHKKRANPTPFGNGAVHHGNVMHLRMDGPIESIEGTQQPMGFVVRVPGRKSLEPAAPLAARDSRIAAIKVTNGPTGADLTVAFRDGVPNYQVSGRGDTLVITLAPAGLLESPVAKRDDKTSTGSPHSKHGRDARDTNPER
jgi:hypothetical protein